MTETYSSKDTFKPDLLSHRLLSLSPVHDELINQLTKLLIEPLPFVKEVTWSSRSSEAVEVCFGLDKSTDDYSSLHKGLRVISLCLSQAITAYENTNSGNSLLWNIKNCKGHYRIEIPEALRTRGIINPRIVSDFVDEDTLCPTTEEREQILGLVQSILRRYPVISPHIWNVNSRVFIESDNFFEDLITNWGSELLDRLSSLNCSAFTFSLSFNSLRELKYVSGKEETLPYALKSQVTASVVHFLSETFPDTEIYTSPDSIVIRMPFSSLPPTTRAKVLDLLDSSKLGYLLYNWNCSGNNLEKSKVKRLIQFCLPEQCVLLSDPSPKNLERINVACPEPALDELVTIEYALSSLFKKKVSFARNQTISEALTKSFDEHGLSFNRIIARASSDDGIIRADAERFIKIIEDTLIISDEARGFCPVHEATTSYQNLETPLIAIGALNSFQEDAFWISSDESGHELFVAIADASFLSPHESPSSTRMYNLYENFSSKSHLIKLYPHSMLKKYGGFKTGGFEPAIVFRQKFSAEWEPLGEIRFEPRLVKLRSILNEETLDSNDSDTMEAYIKLKQFAGAVSGEDSADWNCMEIVRLVQSYVNYSAALFGLSRKLPLIYRKSGEMESLDNPKQILQFHLNDLTNNLKFNSRRLSRSGVYTYPIIPGEIPYCTISGSYRRPMSKVNCEQISRFVRNIPLIDDEEIQGLVGLFNIQYRDKSVISELVTKCGLSNNQMKLYVKKSGIRLKNGSLAQLDKSSGEVVSGGFFSKKTGQIHSWNSTWNVRIVGINVKTGRLVCEPVSD